MADENYFVDVSDGVSGATSHDYGADVLDLFKFGVGSYFNYKAQTIDPKTRYETFGDGLYANGQVANNPIQGSTTRAVNYTPWLIGGGVLLLAVVLLKLK